RETMGLMIGRVYRDDKGTYAVMHRTFTSDLVADATHVRFDAESMDALIDAIDGMADDERIIGWYHSHLDYGVFMSETDVRTQHSLFGEGMGFALVIDPLRGEFAVFDNSPEPQKVRMIVME
ncbi:MAG: Mov34/MPN/PAD-1 family protein, partial [Candidatus Methanomethylophilaceae archaeon]|nr:Mov34/MPN/PAD-1 family protein [Candidatus Methanomethylophilaceae archaeon]